MEVMEGMCEATSVHQRCGDPSLCPRVAVALHQTLPLSIFRNVCLVQNVLSGLHTPTAEPRERGANMCVSATHGQW